MWQGAGFQQAEHPESAGRLEAAVPLVTQPEFVCGPAVTRDHWLGGLND